jgi:phosphomannomutase
MKRDNLIFTFSGIRGLIGPNFNYEIAKKIALAFGQNYVGNDRRIIVGRDTRPSGESLEKGLIEGLISENFEITNVGISPTPIIIHAKTSLNIPAGIIITGSHNSQEWNGLKLLGKKTYLHNSDLNKIANVMHTINPKTVKVKKAQIKKKCTFYDAVPKYIESLKNYIDFNSIKSKNNLRVVVDTGAGAGKIVTPHILQEIGCEVKSINNEFYVKNIFPREIEPIPKNLRDLIMEVWQGKYDIGFAHDSDADRLAIVGEDGSCYPEDVGLALIMDSYLKEYQGRAIFVTNLASSLMFEVIAEKYGAEIIRTPVGEVFLVEEMNRLLESSKGIFIFGGEGSCGGVMFPAFNNTRDGIFAATKLVEILVNSGEKISKLVSNLPKFYSYRQTINVENIDIKDLISKVKLVLINEGDDVVQINNDLRFGNPKDWFVLIHPSNTEPIVRVISEAKSDSLSRIYCEATAELVKLVISNL